MMGKTNPRTKKNYTESDCYAIAVSAYKKKYGKAPSRESSPLWYFNDGKEIRENVNISWDNPLKISESSDSSNNLNMPLIIEGMAINETVTKNNVKYIGEELEKAVKSLIGKPILNSHNNESIDNILGKVIDAKKVDNGVWYKAEIDSDERKVINKIKKGYLNKVSIGANVNELVKTEEKDDIGIVRECLLAKGISFCELSLVSTPGDDNTSVSIVQALSESFNYDSNVFEGFKDEEKLIKMEEKLMTEDTKVLQEKLDASAKMLVEMEAKLKAYEIDKAKVEEEKKINALRESIKQEIMESLKTQVKELGFKKEEKKDESKGTVEPSKTSEEDKKKEESLKKLAVIERGNKGVSFYFLKE